MPAIEIGRICVKTRGREAGKKCVIVDIIDSNFVLVTGPKEINGVKRRRVNILHIEPTDKKVEINKGATDQEVKQAIEQSGLTDFIKEAVKPKIPVI
ncbi:50S ribosomal protein L14e [Sulfolobus acidocaldarius]|uniref:Large ribosomal subunit protein eL14 n=5 Tax=Sulfolobus acidocaldarius TaxID=2285 RepID=RL14E_SULAC|nr:50S ribosomal protein L14e [Sulfolobus acidocaldarius]Q4JAJ9.1 RecName: Full=Large ribosomal subunit protein eL14; AltName: Full=50S ribosomal protein L14e [Sulfolobus acidocaldarius DSM 639]AHC51163.1 50S ribosomal protein L14 [Sulfolobus acidocaldarius SUSAZ]AAY80180.1 50S ribosomal protein L14E [Sulfolobus acidocaldarius DSM 639]AGE70759.1 50S ribosomal protein L14e [Sulfolobus acidocaldarius N8]AGE73030.1 50S ribosomal protein L14e [Sulfolobus acidocaldarius Ron12/I]ALU28914.1 50S ribo